MPPEREAQNINELKDALELLEESNKKLYNSMKAFQIAAEETASLVFTYDTKKQTIFVDERTAEAFQVDTVQEKVPYEMLKRGIISEDTREEYLRIHEAMIKGETEAGGIVKLIPPGAEETVYELKFRAILDEEGNPTGTAVGIYRDITERFLKDREQEVKHKKLERVLKGMQEDYIGIFEVDMQEDTYTTLAYTANDAVSFSETGCYRELIKLFSEKLVAAEYQKIFEEIGSAAYLREALSREKRIEVEYMTTSTDRVWRRNIYQVVEAQNGVPTTAILFQLDIDKQKTEKLMQQQTIQEAYSYAEAASAAKTEFLSRMSHDIRTPMNGIIGMTAIAAANIDNPERVSECLSKITMASRHLLSLINEVLDMSKIESGKMELVEEEFNLGDLIDNMINMVLPQIREHKHNLQVSVEDLDHEWVVGDSLRIQQAFVNLVSNSVKYTPDGGIIKIRIKERPMKNALYGEYEFILEDSGIGMSEEFQQQLFEPFARAEDSRVSKVTGTGLGMAITRTLIRMMDGDISVESKLNEGSRFTAVIHLKLQERDMEQVRELVELPILVVDDDTVTCENACLILNEIGMKSEWCLSGQEAVKRVCRRYERNDSYFAVIIDWKMPGMDGLETVRQIRKKVGGEIPVIIISSYDWSEIEEEARAAGVDRFITKPLFKSRLVTCLKELLQEEKKEASPVAVFAEELRFEGKRILLVEDNELNAEIAGEILEMTGAAVERAANGQDAVDCVERSAEGYYDLIFMDIQMPVLDGYEATAAIRGLNRRDVKRMPIVAMTANAFVEDVSSTLNAGMNAHISKPVDFEELQAVLRKYL